MNNEPTVEIVLNEEQENVRKFIEDNHKHVFVTGKAGTGKSTLLRALEKQTKSRCAVVAPTGVAAVNVNGATIHSFFGLPTDPTEEILIKPYTRTLLNKTQMIIIDEISMVRADLLDAVDAVCREAREIDEPFGGLQVVMFGDVYQLPPVVADKAIQLWLDTEFGGIYFFNAKVWKETSFKTFELQTIFRQKDDEFISVLNSIREGKKLANVLETINKRVIEGEPPECTPILSSTKIKVDQINNKKLAEIQEPEFVYNAMISGTFSKSAHPAPEHLRLKRGAQIMMLRNDSLKRWVNGTIGIVEHCAQNDIMVRIGNQIHVVAREEWNKSNYSYNAFGNGRLERKSGGQFIQFPLALAWAITIHKSQGKTLDSAFIDLHFGAFTSGQAYVALSRCISLHGVYLKRPLKKKDIIVDEKIVEFMRKQKLVNEFMIPDFPVHNLSGGVMYIESITKTPEEKQEIMDKGNKAMEDLYG